MQLCNYAMILWHCCKRRIPLQIHSWVTCLIGFKYIQQSITFCENPLHYEDADKRFFHGALWPQTHGWCTFVFQSENFCHKKKKEHIQKKTQLSVSVNISSLINNHLGLTHSQVFEHTKQYTSSYWSLCVQQSCVQ